MSDWPSSPCVSLSSMKPHASCLRGAVRASYYSCVDLRMSASRSGIFTQLTNSCTGSIFCALSSGITVPRCREMRWLRRARPGTSISSGDFYNSSRSWAMSGKAQKQSQMARRTLTVPSSLFGLVGCRRRLALLFASGEGHLGCVKALLSGAPDETVSGSSAVPRWTSSLYMGR